MRILIINGPNINMLGIREPDIYGRSTYQRLCEIIENYAEEKEIDIELFQSNHEGKIVDKIQSALNDFEGIIINPAAYTHTSVAILDALKAVAIPAVEVHLSDVFQREDFRKISYAGMACCAHYIGMGFDGYIKAIDYLLENYGS